MSNLVCLRISHNAFENVDSQVSLSVILIKYICGWFGNTYFNMNQMTPAAGSDLHHKLDKGKFRSILFTILSPAQDPAVVVELASMSYLTPAFHGV